MTTAILYHQVKPGVDCPDGIAAAYITQKGLIKLDEPENNPIDIIGCVYGEEPPNVENYDRIIIVDFSFSRSTIEQWGQSKKIVVLIDHHKTALEMLGDISTFSEIFDPTHVDININLQECGATLAWKYYFNPNTVPAVFEYTRDRDLWNFELPRSEEIHEAIANLRYKISDLARSIDIDPQPLLFALFDSLVPLTQEELIDKLSLLGAKLLAPKRERIAAAASRFRWANLPNPQIYTDRIPVVDCNPNGSEDRLVSDICAKLYRDLCPDAAFVACITSDGKWSLRSNKHGSDFDVSAIAQHYGGGGHKNAAGFTPTKSA
jgi:uncharacterized protein